MKHSGNSKQMQKDYTYVERSNSNYVLPYKNTKISMKRNDPTEKSLIPYIRSKKNPKPVSKGGRRGGGGGGGKTFFFFFVGRKKV